MVGSDIAFEKVNPNIILQESNLEKNIDIILNSFFYKKLFSNLNPS